MKMIRRPGLARIAAAGIVLLAALAVSASAETWKGLELKRKMDDAPWQFGPFQIQPTLVIANAGVDSNIFYSPSEPIKDYTVTAGPAATIYLPIHRKFRAVGLRIAAVRLVLQDGAGADLELLSQRGGPAEPEERLLQPGRRLLGRPGAVEHGDRHPAPAEGGGLRRLHAGQPGPQDFVLPGAIGRSSTITRASCMATASMSGSG